jgi:class 3 adenylate cyclase
VTDVHLALHAGELLYGNLGGPRRLDFTVLGSAVNEAGAHRGALRVARPRRSSCRGRSPKRRARHEAVS